MTRLTVAGVAAQRPEPGENAVFVRAGEPTVADDIGNQDCRQFSGFAHIWAPAAGSLAQWAEDVGRRPGNGRARRGSTP
jgi:hypothetical protein